MRFEALKSKPVLSIADGTELGRVHELLLAESFTDVAALVIGGGGLFGGPKKAVAYGAIRSLGQDAVMVQGHEAVEEIGSESRLASLPALGDLHQEVMSEQGARLGRVQDAEFDPQTGAVTHLWFAAESPRWGQKADVWGVARDDILSINSERIVVRQSASHAQAS